MPEGNDVWEEYDDLMNSLVSTFGGYLDRDIGLNPKIVTSQDLDKAISWVKELAAMNNHLYEQLHRSKEDLSCVSGY